MAGTVASAVAGVTMSATDSSTDVALTHMDVGEPSLNDLFSILELRTGHTAMIRIRRLPKRPFRRPPYEVEFRPADIEGGGWHKVTAYPVFEIEKIVGTGDAWSMIHAADAAWDGTAGDWITTYAPGETP